MPTIQNRRATRSVWASANPVLAAGEIGFEIDTNKIKIGNGLSPWNSLRYFVDERLIREMAASGVGDVTPSNGFAPYRAGVTSHAIPHELAVVKQLSANPVGPKSTVIAETWDRPGKLNHIWTANTGNGLDDEVFSERGGRILIYIDDWETPVIDLTLAEFFGYVGMATEYETPRIARTKRGVIGDPPDTTQSSSYRYLDIPFQNYMRVEIVNETPNEAVAFYSMASYTLGDQVGPLSSFRIKSVSVDADKFEKVEVGTFEGSGQLESIFLAFEGATNDYGAMEGNVEIYVDGEAHPRWKSPGGEDAFNGGWYRVPVGGYPAGRAGDTAGTGMAVQWYRFFTNDPIMFSTSLRVVFANGQQGQGFIGSDTVRLTANVGAWLTESETQNYPSPGPLYLNEDFTNGLAGWSSAPDKAASFVEDGVVKMAYGTTGAYEDIRHSKTIEATDYFVTGLVRITNASATDQQVSILAQGASPDPYFGSAIHVSLFRDFDPYGWTIRVQDDFDSVGFTRIGGGRNLTNVWVELGLRVVGDQASAYYRMPGEIEWTPVCKWTSSKSGTAVGFGAWRAGCEIDRLRVHSIDMK